MKAIFFKFQIFFWDFCFGTAAFDTGIFLACNFISGGSPPYPLSGDMIILCVG